MNRLRRRSNFFKDEKNLGLLYKAIIPSDKLSKVVEKYRSAQLSLLKAKIHEFQEKQYEGKSQSGNLESLEREIRIWTNKTTEGIIQHCNTEL